MSIQIKSDGTPHGTRVTDTRTGTEMHGITGIAVGIDLDRMQVDLALEFVPVDVTVPWRNVRWLAGNPLTGRLAEVRHVIYADGTMVSFGDGEAPRAQPL